MLSHFATVVDLSRRVRIHCRTAGCLVSLALHEMLFEQLCFVQVLVAAAFFGAVLPQDSCVWCYPSSMCSFQCLLAPLLGPSLPPSPLTHSLTNSLHSLTHSLHSLTHSLTRMNGLLQPGSKGGGRPSASGALPTRLAPSSPCTPAPP